MQEIEAELYCCVNKRMTLWVFGAALSVGLVAGVIIFLAFYRRRIRSDLETTLPFSETNLVASSSSNLDAINFGPRRFSYAELRIATDDFSKDKLLGEGGFGSVYQGVILEAQENQLMVAIKRMAKNSKQGRREFQAEVLSIGRLRHRNLASLLGWCHEGDELLLVYEFMAKGSLNLHLYHKSGYPTLPWSCRFQILQGIASALEYLHGGWEKCILHRDIKPSNILLDSCMTARLGDFGLARLASHTIVGNNSTGLSSTVGGTLGYMAPEVVLYGQLTKKADVYSFGMVTLEVVCGRRPQGFHSEDCNEGEENLVEWVWTAHKKGQLLEVMDPVLHESPEMQCKIRQDEVTCVLHLGMLCTLLDPPLRPPTNRLMQALSGDCSISLPPSRWDSGPCALSLTSRLIDGGQHYADYLGARRYSFAELSEATKGFSPSSHMSTGSHGDIYRGSIVGNKHGVVVKKIAANIQPCHLDFLTLIGRSRHRNLLTLHGWCYELQELFLVYEFMENGFLDAHLYPPEGEHATLSWPSRFKILKDVAAAVDYIHNGIQENSGILYRAIKPSNVMLNEHMTAKLADFGLYRLVGGDEMAMAEVASPYIAPELVSGGCEAASVKSDVYSFGMMALEMVFRRAPHAGEEILKWREGGQLLDVIDAALGKSASLKQNDTHDEGLDSDEVMKQQITRVLHLGMMCCLPEANLRPHSNQLLQALYGDWNVSLLHQKS